MRTQAREVFQRLAVRDRRARCEICVSDTLAAERRRLQRQRLRGRGDFTRDVGRGDGDVLDRKKRFARFAVKNKNVSRLRDLGDSRNGFSVTLQHKEIRWRRQIAVPDVVTRDLKMPLALASARVEAQQCVREKIISRAIAAPVIIRWRARRDEEEPALLIHRHASPAIRATGEFPRVGWPRLVTKLTRVRDGAKRPCEFARFHVERANVAGGRRARPFVCSNGQNEKILEQRAGRRRRMEGHASRVAPEAFVEIDSTCVSEGRNHAAVVRVNRKKKMSGGMEDAAVVAATPIRHAPAAVRQKLRLGPPVPAIRRVCRGIEAPELAAAGGLEGD